MRRFWRCVLYTGFAALAISAALLGFSEVVRGEVREQQERFDAEDDAMNRAGVPFEERAAAMDAQEAILGPKRRLQGRLEIGGLVGLMAGLVLTAAGALAPGAKRATPPTADPLAGREDEGW